GNRSDSARHQSLRLWSAARRRCGVFSYGSYVPDSRTAGGIVSARIVRRRLRILSGLGETMDEALYVQLLNLAAGFLLFPAVLALWRRELSGIIHVLALLGFALAGLTAVRAADQGSVELWGVAAGLLVLRAGVLPFLLRRVLTQNGPERRETTPLMNVVASLLTAALLTLLAYAASQPLVRLSPTPAVKAVPVALTVVLIGFFILVTRRYAISQLIGFLLLDNGITAIGFLTVSGVDLVVELGVSLDVLFVVLVLQILTTRMRDTFGATDLDELRELRG